MKGVLMKSDALLIGGDRLFKITVINIVQEFEGGQIRISKESVI